MTAKPIIDARTGKPLTKADFYSGRGPLETRPDVLARVTAELALSETPEQKRADPGVPHGPRCAKRFHSAAECDCEKG